MISVTAEQRSEHLRWLLELTSIPTASGKEARVIAWIERWVAERAEQGVTLSRDPAGNLVVRSGGAARSTSQGLSGGFGASGSAAVGASAARRSARTARKASDPATIDRITPRREG